MEDAQAPDEGKKTAKTPATKAVVGTKKPVAQAPKTPTAKPTTPVEPVSPVAPAKPRKTSTKAPATKARTSRSAPAKPRASKTSATPELAVDQSDVAAKGLEQLRSLASKFAAPAQVAQLAQTIQSEAPVKPVTQARTSPSARTPPLTPELRPEPEPEPASASVVVLAEKPTLTHALDAASSDGVLAVRGLSKGFGDTVAVNDIDLTVPAGVFYGIVGPNGAGKTTTLSMITGLLRPDSGTASVNGVNVWDSPEVAKRSMGVLPDRLRIFDRLTGSQLLYYSGVLRGLGAAEVRKRSADLAAAFGLEDVMGRLVSDYSSGMLKKVALAAAMIHSPRLLVLDEPFESVDPVSATTVTRILQQYVDAGGTVLLSSHRMELVQRVCSHVAVIVEGTLLADGTIHEVRDGMSLEDRFVQLTGKNSSGGGLEWLSSFSD